MDLRFSIAGFPATWRFRHSDRLETWLDETPWSSQGGIRVARIPSNDLFHTFGAALRRAFRAHDDGATESFQIQLAIGDDARVPFGRFVAESLGIRHDLDSRSPHFIRAAAGELLKRSRVFILAPGAADTTLVPSARSTLEALTKTQDGAALTVVFLDTAKEPLTTEPDFDLVVGSPIVNILEEIRSDEGRLWRAYVHSRIAWEAAGDLDRALRWDLAGASNLTRGSDSQLENMLNAWAVSEYNCISSEGHIALCAYLNTLGNRNNGAARNSRALQRSLLSAGMLWCPLNEMQFRPTPWTARAVLLSNSIANDTSRFLLRSCLVCAPLAREVIGRCLDMESHERTALWAERGPLSPASTTTAQWEQFQKKKETSARRYYPSSSPALPDDVWYFAGFWEFLSGVKAGVPFHDHLLRTLRNSLAHGHYVSWRTILDMRDIERAIK